MRIQKNDMGAVIFLATIFSIKYFGAHIISLSNMHMIYILIAMILAVGSAAFMIASYF